VIAAGFAVWQLVENSPQFIVSRDPGAYAQFQLSIPSANLSDVMARLSRLHGAQVASRTDTTQDVNDQYVKLTRQLADDQAPGGDRERLEDLDPVDVAAEVERQGHGHEQGQPDDHPGEGADGGARLGPRLAPHAMDDRARAEWIEQRLTRHAEVRALVVGWDAALVSPPDFRLAPIRLEPRRQLVRPPRRPAACQHEVAAGARALREPLRDDAGRPLDVGLDLEPDVYSSPAASSRERSIAA